MLPDHDWLEEEEDDSEEQDYGTENGLEQSLTESMISEETATPTSPSPAQPLSRLSRYGTYFHHPERRRQTVPGAFPVR
jgi:hypothetical protein